MKKVIALILYLNFIIIIGKGQPPLKFPVPHDVPNQLFYLQRTPNVNTVIYALNQKDGVLDSVEPIHIFWIRYADKAQRQELTEIESKFAYGLGVKKLESEHYELRFHAKKEHTFVLKKGDDNQFHVYATIDGKPAVLRKIYLHINGGPMFSPNIEYVMFYGTAIDTGDQVAEQLKL